MSDVNHSFRYRR